MDAKWEWKGDARGMEGEHGGTNANGSTRERERAWEHGETETRTQGDADGWMDGWMIRPCAMPMLHEEREEKEREREERTFEVSTHPSMFMFRSLFRR